MALRAGALAAVVAAAAAQQVQSSTIATLVKRDDGACDLRRTSLKTGESTVVGPPVAWCAEYAGTFPSALTYNPTTDELVAVLPGTNDVVAVDARTAAWHSIAPTPPSYYADDNLLCAYFVRGELYVFSAWGVEILSGGVLRPAFSAPELPTEASCAFDGDATVYLAQSNSSAVWSVNIATETVNKDAFNGVSQPRAMAWDPSSNVVYSLQNWGLWWTNPQTSKNTYVDDLAGSGGPVYLHPRSFGISTDGETAWYIDFNNIYIAPSYPFSNWPITAPYATVTRSIGITPAFVKD
jgi:hypothetical protein